MFSVSVRDITLWSKDSVPVTKFVLSIDEFLKLDNILYKIHLRVELTSI